MHQQLSSPAPRPSPQFHKFVPLEPFEPPVMANLKSGSPSTTAAQVHHADRPRTHPEWLLFQWSLRALDVSDFSIEQMWVELLWGVRLQEALNSRLRECRLIRGSGRIPLPFRRSCQSNGGETTTSPPTNSLQSRWLRKAADSNRVRRPSTLNGYFERVASALGPFLQVEPGQGPMALWSGPYDVAAYAQLQGYTTLEGTPGGRVLARLELYRDAKAVAPLWKYLSREFVRRNPVGQAHVFVRAHNPRRPLYCRALPAVDKSAPLRPTIWHPVSSEQLEVVGTR